MTKNKKILRMFNQTTIFFLLNFMVVTMYTSNILINLRYVTLSTLPLGAARGHFPFKFRPSCEIIFESVFLVVTNNERNTVEGLVPVNHPVC